MLEELQNSFYLNFFPSMIHKYTERYLHYILSVMHDRFVVFLYYTYLCSANHNSYLLSMSNSKTLFLLQPTHSSINPQKVITNKVELALKRGQ